MVRNRSDWHGQTSDERSLGKGASHMCSLYVPFKVFVPIEKTRDRESPGAEDCRALADR